MKKILEVVFFFIILLLFNSVVYADFDDISIEPFKAYISNGNGAAYYDENSFYTKEQKSSGNLKYQEKIDIIEELNINNKVYGMFLLKDMKYYVELSNLKSLDEPYTNINKELKHELVILSEKGVEMRNGPSANYYSVIDKIPKGVKLVGYSVKGYELSVPWLYVEYKGKKGWITYEYDEIGHTYETTSNVLIIGEISLYSDIELSNEICKISPYTVINAKNFISLNFRNLYIDEQTKKAYNYDENKIDTKNYIKYDGKEGYISIKEYGIECNKSYTIHTDDNQLYEWPDGSSKILDNIPNGTKIDYNYYSKMKRLDGTTWEYGFWAYTKYNGKSGWIQVIDDGYIETRNDALESIVENETSQNSDNNRHMKIAVVIISTIILMCLIMTLIYIEKNKNK